MTFLQPCVQRKHWQEVNPPRRQPPWHLGSTYILQWFRASRLRRDVFAGWLIRGKDPSLIEEHLDKFFSILTCTWWLASSLDRNGTATFQSYEVWTMMISNLSARSTQVTLTAMLFTKVSGIVGIFCVNVSQSNFSWSALDSSRGLLKWRVLFRSCCTDQRWSLLEDVVSCVAPSRTRGALMGRGPQSRWCPALKGLSVMRVTSYAG